MSDPEPDAIFGERLVHVVSEELRPYVVIASGAELDVIGRRYDRFRTGVPLKGFEAASDHPASRLPEGLWNRR
jgi:hypothetical protein